MLQRFGSKPALLAAFTLCCFWLIAQQRPAANARAAFATITVNTTADTIAADEQCSLREAVQAANTNVAVNECAAGTAGLDTINFNLGAGTPTINVTTALPTITEPLTIDGATGGATRVELNGTGAGAGVNGLTITAGGSTLQALVINRFGGSGISISTAGGNTIRNCLIGTNAAGAAAAANGGSGVNINNVPNNIIGGTTAAERNIISGNNGAVTISGASASGNVIQGNYIGTDAAGMVGITNGNLAVSLIQSPNNTIGGTTSGAGNVISGNGAFAAIRLNGSGGGMTGNVIQGNLIGLNAAGTATIPNGGTGVELFDFGTGGPTNTLIGGTTAAARNVIAGNGNRGIVISGPTVANNTVQGNYIGTDVNGTADLGNTNDGILIQSGAHDNVIGGTTAGARNIISGNNANGIQISAAATTANLIQGNFIGTNAPGTAALPNTSSGVLINGAANNTIGGTAVGARNLISGNNDNGITISGAATANQIQGNFIGTNAAGTAALGNRFDGVLINNVPNNVIGGTAAGAGNLISGNSTGGPGFDGIRIAGAGATGNVVQGNLIGTDVTGTAALPNNGSGILISDIFANGGPSNNLVGGTAAGARNVISGNSFTGISIGNVVGGLNSSNNTVQGNFIGTTITGTAPLANGNAGVLLGVGATNNTVGGAVAGARNVLSGNATSGVGINGASAANNTVQGNFIGTDASGTVDLGNTVDGVLINNGANNNTIGGTATGAGNVISGNNGDGVEINGSAATGNLIQGNFIGTNAAGTGGLGNGSNGVHVNGAPANTVGGAAASAGNIISGNGVNGVRLVNATTANNLVQGNFIGTDVNGTTALGNTIDGIRIEAGANNNTVGGTTANARNTLSGNGSSGIQTAGAAATGNLIQGNFIGTNATGTAAIGNGGAGVTLNSSLNTVGGTVAGANNVISGNNDDGVEINGSAVTANLILGNFIGTNAAGTAALGNNSDGVEINAAPGNTIGGTTVAARNVISGNGSAGIFISAVTAVNNVVQGNFLGTNAAGAAALGNGAQGIQINAAPNNTVGGISVGQGNVIAGNLLGGVFLTGGANNTQVQGNLIGTNAAGTAAVPNISQGVDIRGSSNNLVGGMGAARNVISGNTQVGVFISVAPATGNQVQGNFIGTDISGTAALPNGNDGVRLDAVSGNTIGGLGVGQNNLIAFNTGRGVNIVGVAPGTGNRLSRNAIISNGNLGIDLGGNGVTANDGGDADTGANNLQNFPLLTGVAVNSFGTTVLGLLNSTANTAFRLEFFSSPVGDPSGNGEGQTFLGSTEVATDAKNLADFNVTLPVAVTIGHVVTATATAIVAGDTSEFSPWLCTFALSPNAVNFDAAGGGSSFTVTTGGACAWTAINSDSWITVIGGASGTGNGTVTFMVGANSGATSRSGAITVGGNTFAVGQAAPGVLLDEPFDNGFPPGTVIIDGGTGGGGAATWRTTNAIPCQRPIPPPLIAPAVVMDAGCAGPGAVQDEQLILPPFNATGQGKVFFEFDSFFSNVLNAPETGDVDVSLNGQSWTNILRFQSTDTPRTIAPIDITNLIAPNPANVRIRFHYYGSLGSGGNRPSGEQMVFWLVDRPMVTYFSLSTSSLAVAPAGGAQSITVTAAPGRAWTAQPPGVAWITGLTTNGTGTMPVNFTVAANTAAAPRMTTVPIAGNTLTVTQSGLCANITISPPTLPNGAVGTPYSATLSATPAGTYTFRVSAGTLPTNVALNQNTGELSGMPTVGGSFTFTITAANADNCANSRQYTVIIGNNGLQFYPLPRPLRLVDTRADQSLCDNIGVPITGGSSITTQARLTCQGVTIPATAQAIVGNVTAINQTASFGFLTLFPAGQPLPLAANMIYEPGQLLSNNFTVGLSASGEFNTFAERTIHVVIDVSGYFAPPTPAGLFYHALPRPLRLLDTRADQSLCDNVGAPITGGTALTTQARISCNSITIPTAAQAIVGNATVINQTASFGFLTLFPSGQTLPLAANMIYAPGQLLSNYFTVGLSAGGSFDTFAERTLHVVIDVAGYYSTEANDANGPGLLFNPLPRPLRLLDTRADQSLCDNIGAPIAAGTSLTTQARISCNGITIPASAQAVNGNITVINQTASFGFLTLFPAGQTLPLAANMIYAPSQLLSNAFVVGLSGLGEFNTFGERTIHVVVDVSGYFAP